MSGMQRSVNSLISSFFWFVLFVFRSSHRKVSLKKVFWEISQHSQENTCARVSFLLKHKACNFIKKETLAQVFSCECCKILKNIFSYGTPLVFFDKCRSKVCIVTEKWILICDPEKCCLQCDNIDLCLTGCHYWFCRRS